VATTDQANLDKIMKRVDELVSKILFAASEGSEEMKEQAQYYKAELESLEKILGIKINIKKIAEDQKEEEEEISKLTELTKDKAMELGNNLQSVVESIPLVGNILSKAFDLESAGQNIADLIVNPLMDAEDATEDLTVAQRIYNAVTNKNVWLAIAAAIIAAASAIRFLVAGAKDLASDLGISASQANDIMFSVKGAELSMSAMGYDSEDLRNTMKAVVDEFGSLENLSVSSAKQISMMAQDFGTTGGEIIKLNKSMMDLTGMSFEAATNFSQVAADMARTAGVSAGKVIEDMAANANKFAEFSMDGANGLAQAAIEAAKVGANLSMVLGAADKLLELETSLTSQFEAQVLTGKNLNLELARQAALEGDVLGLTQEIQKTVGSLGEIQSMNVIERRAIAEAIGISSDELLKVARGEQIKEQESVQSLQKETNKILISGFSDSIDAYQEGQNKGFTDSLVY
jgi:hypothetical protein